MSQRKRRWANRKRINEKEGRAGRKRGFGNVVGKWSERIKRKLLGIVRYCDFPTASGLWREWGSLCSSMPRS
jgi:hypothetical protein